MRLAKGCTRPTGKVEFSARFDPDIFRIVTDYAKAHRLSVNRALAVLVWRGAESDKDDRGDKSRPAGSLPPIAPPAETPAA